MPMSYPPGTFQQQPTVMIPGTSMMPPPHATTIIAPGSPHSYHGPYHSHGPSHRSRLLPGRITEGRVIAAIHTVALLHMIETDPTTGVDIVLVDLGVEVKVFHMIVETLLIVLMVKEAIDVLEGVALPLWMKVIEAVDILKEVTLAL
ncbi:hypothetical protein E1B28_011859 [Marasmius oreades]|uniref:Uncharacterized protein n=1 Tax=Marasmius oreades TaxID=181124 RepID=A0A9P7RVM5_9AGAR|nr:uncharacterized protein E1B28_011859 [Marasmius oreades]KAG7090262.1 hypothetical protein E1B28_011859 [Marasmius oreades]